jgi:hypothetical protein
MIVEMTKDLCVYCLDKATVSKDTGKYLVGLCDVHKDLDSNDIDEILGDVKIKKRGIKTLIP